MPWLVRGSSIVFISSAGARTALANYAALGGGKALAESLIRYLVPELAPRGVRINAVARGLVATTSVAQMAGGDDAAVVDFLLGDGARFVQGQVVHANGGAWVG